MRSRPECRRSLSGDRRGRARQGTCVGDADARRRGARRMKRPMSSPRVVLGIGVTKAVYHSLRHPPHTQSRISREQASKRKSGKFFEGFDVSPEGSSAKVTYCANSRWEMVSKQGRWGHFWLSEGSACRKPRKNLARDCWISKSRMIKDMTRTRERIRAFFLLGGF